jgi:hypothetical protein
MKFAKLRFDAFAKAAAAGVITGAIALQPMPAVAGNGSSTVVENSAIWAAVTGDSGGTPTPGTAVENFGIRLGTLFTGPRTQSVSRSGAYAAVFDWFVYQGNSLAGAYTPQGGVTIVPNPPQDPAVSATITGNPMTIAGLTVTGQLYFSSRNAVARSVLLLTNPTGAPITVNVANLNAVNGADVVEAQSGSGNWVVLDTPSLEGPNQPVATRRARRNAARGVQQACATPVPPGFPCPGGAAATTFVSGGVNAPVPAPATVLTPINGEFEFQWNYAGGNGITVPAGQTVALMVFTQMSATTAAATAAAQSSFSNLGTLQSAGYVDSLPRVNGQPLQASQILNWSGSLAPTTVPTLSQWNLAGLAGLLGLAGLGAAGAFRRRFSATETR